MKLLVTRHGQSEWQVRGDVVGLDPRLTPLGELQARRLGRYLRDEESPQVIYTSPLRRAYRTAQLLAESLDAPMYVEDDLREFEDWAAGWAPEPVSMWDAQPNGDVSPGYAAFRQRVTAAAQRIVAAHPETETLLLVAHGGTIGTLLRSLVGSETLRAEAGNTSLQKLEWNRPRWGVNWVIHYLNRQEHLPPYLRTA